MKNILFGKIIISIAVFLFGLMVFSLLQNQTIFDYSLGKVAFTFANKVDSTTLDKKTQIVRTSRSFTTLDEDNFIRWDVGFYKYMSEKGYGTDNSWPGVGTFAFSPLFPFVWHMSHLSAKYIVILNYALFALSLMLLTSLFISKTDYSQTDQLLIFAFALTLPSVFSFYIPYCESTFMFTFSLALWGLFRGKHWLFYVAMVACTLSRPSFLIVGLAFIATDFYLFLLNKNFKLFIKELAMKLWPIVLGMFITFFIQYLYCGSFFKMFQVHSQLWGHNFQYPTKFTDWSAESWGLNVFSISCLILPVLFFLVLNLVVHYKTGKIPAVRLFSRVNKRDYLQFFCSIYFVGNFLFVMLAQGGNLNGLHRYIMASPLFYVFIFIMIPRLKGMKKSSNIILVIILGLIGYFILIHGPYTPKMTFLYMGFFLSILSFLYIFTFNLMKARRKIVYLSIIILLNTIWLGYLFNHFLNNAYIIA